MGNQQSLFHDSVHDAAGAVILSLGGKKHVAQLLWPHLKPESAYTRLAHCLSEDDQQKFSIQELMFLMREGRKIGDHSLVAYVNQDAGYGPPVPVDPVDEAEQLRRDIRDELASLNKRMARLERIESRERVESRIKAVS